MHWTQKVSEFPLHSPRKSEVHDNPDNYSRPRFVSGRMKRKYSSLVCYSDSGFVHVPKVAKRRHLSIKHVRCATTTIQRRSTVNGLYCNSKGKMTPQESHVDYTLSTENNPEQTLENDNVEHTNSQDRADEASPVPSNPELGDDLLVRVLAARLTHVMQGEEEEIEAIAFLQLENDALRTQLIQRSCGRGGGDHADDDLYAHWLRQQTRLERMKALHERIRAHRVEVRRLLGLQMIREVDGQQRFCGEDM